MTAGLALLTACGQRDDTAAAPGAISAPEAIPAPADTSTPASGASVQLTPTQSHSAFGTLNLLVEGDAVRINGTLQGLSPKGEFGFHIHEKGDCSAPDASSAGGHFNPANAQHGNPQGESHHAGDMLNAISDAAGVAQVDAVATGVSLTSGLPNDIHGRAIVMHEKPDDYSTQPSGNSGARIACGVIN